MPNVIHDSASIESILQEKLFNPPHFSEIGGAYIKSMEGMRLYERLHR
jgi:hypothetical protein